METNVKEISRKLPLVSVVVITYNSSKYVLETLESIKNQTYKNIELVISDDCSTDETVKICREWVERNKNSFSNAVVITAKVNGGIPANCNQGLKNSHGKWIKLIAGDDLLLPTCIESFYEASLKNPEASCFVSGMYALRNGLIDQCYNILAKRFPQDASRQLDNFLRYSSIPSPAVFIEKQALVHVGGFDERYPGVEDYPLYLRLASSGYYFVPVSMPTVIYRIHVDSVTQSGESFFGKSIRAHFEDVVLPLVKERKLYALTWHYWLNERIAKSQGIKKHALSLLTRLTDFFYWQKKFFLLIGLSQFLQVKIIDLPPDKPCSFLKNDV